MAVSAKALSAIRALPEAGKFGRASWRTVVKPAAAHKGVVLTKTTVAVVESGTAFADLPAVQVAIAKGERGEVGSLPWGEWAQFPYIVAHKDREYLRVNIAPEGIVSVEYRVDGKVVTKDEFDSFLTPGARAKRETPLTVTIPVENLLVVNDVTLGA